MRLWLRRCVGVGLILGVLAAAGRVPAGSASSPLLSGVWISGGILTASYRLPDAMEPYGLAFASPDAAGLPMVLLPGAADGRVSRFRFTATRLSTFLLTSTRPDPIAYQVRLLYGRKNGCGRGAAWNARNLSWNDVVHCPHQTSNPVRLLVGDLLGPGTLLGSATDSGDYAEATVSGTVKTPNSFRIEVSSPTQATPIHLDWDLTCTKNGSVKEANGSWDDLTPVYDTSSIHLPFATLTSSPDRCDYFVAATITPGDEPASIPTGTVTLQLYAYTTHL